MTATTDPRRLAAELAVAELAADLEAWIAWADETGAVDLPSEPLAPLPSLSPPAPQAAPPSQARAPAHAPGRAAPRPPPQRPPQARRPPAPAPRSAGPGEAGAALDAIRADLGNCQRCQLHQGRKNIVFGVGSPDADLVLVGEAPGYYEDVTGEPFVGRSGQLLTRMLAAIGLPRESVYICNVLKCRPPSNRDPLGNEIAVCSPFLHRQLEAIAPKVIMTLGRFAGCNIVGADLAMGELRQRVASYRQVPVVPTYHPAYLLRNPAMKRGAWEDLLKVRKLIRGGGT